MARTDIVLHLFQPEDRVRWPVEWPEGFGAVAAVEGSRSILGVLAFHPSEKPGDAVARIARRLGLPALLTPVHPAVTGLTQATVDRGEEARARDALSSLLDTDLQTVEDAADFALNFEFATSEGLSLHAHLPGVHGAPAQVDPVPVSPLPAAAPACEPVALRPPGFVPLADAGEPARTLRGATIRETGTDECLLRLGDSDVPTARTSRRDWSVGWTARSIDYAIPLSRVRIDGALPSALVIPFRIPALTEGMLRDRERSVPVVTVSNGWLFLSIVQEPLMTVHRPAEDRRRLAGPLRVLPAALAQVIILLITVGVLIVLAAERIEPKDPVDALRKGLFETGIATPGAVIQPIGPRF